MRSSTWVAGFGVNAIELGRGNQTVHGGLVLATAVSAGKQEVAPAQRNAASHPLRGWVVDLDAAIVGITRRGWPQLKCGQDRRRRLRHALQLSGSVVTTATSGRSRCIKLS